MKLYQPVLFVGLGGTGCLIGAELERRLREEFCGADGTAFQRLREDALPYQLPDCMQFVYADVNQADLDRLQTNVVPGPQHVYVQRTAHYVRGLVPQVDTYPEVARNLRLTAEREVAAWLPPEPGEPRVTPQRGADQLPTIGRAALFETFRGGIGAATADLNTAIGLLSGPQAATDLYKIGGKTNNKKAVDVFVAFSVAGGTGTGIFYDYLHLIGELFEHTDVRPKIYPLVLMPSAFVDGLGGGLPRSSSGAGAAGPVPARRPAERRRRAARPARAHHARARRPRRGRRPLPGGRPDRAAAGHRADRIPVPLTGGRRAGRPAPLGGLADAVAARHRAGPALHQGRRAAPVVRRQLHQRQRRPADPRRERHRRPRGVDRAGRVADGAGGRARRPRRRAAAARRGGRPARRPSGPESNRPLIQEFLAVANISEIFTRPAQDHAEPEPVTGAKEVTAALNDRAEAMRAALARLRTRLDKEIPDRVSGFDPRDAVPGCWPGPTRSG